MEHENGISKAVRLAGNQSKLALGVGVTPQAVQKWEKAGYVPAGKRCLDVEAFLEKQVTRYELNPEVYGIPAETAGATAEQVQS